MHAQRRWLNLLPIIVTEEDEGGHACLHHGGATCFVPGVDGRSVQEAEVPFGKAEIYTNKQCGVSITLDIYAYL